MTQTPDSPEFVRSNEPGEFYVTNGVGPHPLPIPTGPEYDADLLAHGDSRNILDEYRYWTVEAIRENLEQTRNDFEVAIENWQHDLNIGSLVRTANAFNARAVHIIGKKHWNQHGALMTDKYLDVFHHSTVADFKVFVAARAIVGFEDTENAQDLNSTPLPKSCVLLFGNEGLGLSDEALAVCDKVVAIPQFGSVRSINASAAGAIGMFEWMRQHVLPGAK